MKTTPTTSTPVPPPLPKCAREDCENVVIPQARRHGSPKRYCSDRCQRTAGTRRYAARWGSFAVHSPNTQPDRAPLPSGLVRYVNGRLVQ